MTQPARDRFIALQASTTWNGVDFVEVDVVDPTILRVHFINTTDVKQAGMAATISGGDRIPDVPVADIMPADWSTDDEARPLLTLHALGDGDFSNYRLTLVNAARLDRAYQSVQFSFKVFCPSDFDCEPAPPDCPPDDVDVPPIDYLAKDFLSFKQALSEFSALRYPQWQERSEADLGVMFMEALSSVADELSYMQDRVSAEAALETATQRRSVTSLARLVDYEPLPAISGSTLLLCQVTGGPLPAGVKVSAASPDGAETPFEIGTGLTGPAAYPVSVNWNYPIAPYWWDDADRCLARGATEMWLQGVGFGFPIGTALLIQTDLPGESLRQVVHLTAVEESQDPLFPPGGPPTRVTRIAWGPDDALTRERDLTRTAIGGNLIPATQGQRASESFAVGAAPVPGPDLALAIARRGPNATDDQPNWIYRYPLARSPVAWLPGPAGGAPAPEIVINQTEPGPQPWGYLTSLLDADELEAAYTLDPVAWRMIDPGDSASPPQWEIDGDGGQSLRFGDDVFGLAPVAGDVFQVSYRTGAGAAGNVAADSIGNVDPVWMGLLQAARNPFAVTDGRDAEDAEHIRRMAPQAFRARQFRAVRRTDYEAAARELAWVQQAGTAFRWTGSWLTVFTAADPGGREVIAPDQHLELIELLNRRRLAGYEAYAPPPRYVSIDLALEICVAPDSIPGDVAKAVTAALAGASDAKGFFFVDRFTFATPLFRSRLEAAVQAVNGVKGVLGLSYRRRGFTGGFVDLPEVLPLAADEILRIDNNPDFPERGVVRVTAEGGR